VTVAVGSMRGLIGFGRAMADVGAMSPNAAIAAAAKAAAANLSDFMRILLTLLQREFPLSF